MGSMCCKPAEDLKQQKKQKLEVILPESNHATSIQISKAHPEQQKQIAKKSIKNQSKAPQQKKKAEGQKGQSNLQNREITKQNLPKDIKNQKQQDHQKPKSTVSKGKQNLSQEQIQEKSMKKIKSQVKSQKDNLALCQDQEKQLETKIETEPSINNQLRLAQVKYTIGYMQQQRKNSEAAQKKLVQALNIFNQEIKLDQKAQQVHTNTLALLGYIHDSKTKPNDASKYFKQAIKMFRQYKLTESQEYKQTLKNAAVNIFFNHQFQDSFDLFRECLSNENDQNRKKQIQKKLNICLRQLSNQIIQTNFESIKRDSLELAKTYLGSDLELIDILNQMHDN